MSVGTEWLVDACGCDPLLLRKRAVVQQVCDEVIRDLDLHVIGAPAFHQFPDPGGFTVFYMLTESHLACHTYPESGVATFNLYCCRERPDWAWLLRLRQLIGAETVNVRTVQRGEESTARTNSSRELAGAKL